MQIVHTIYHMVCDARNDGNGNECYVTRTERILFGITPPGPDPNQMSSKVIPGGTRKKSNALVLQAGPWRGLSASVINELFHVYILKFIIILCTHLIFV